jgi:hypothetical protein
MKDNVIHLKGARRNFLSVVNVYPNDPFAGLILDLGEPYEFIPATPGVLILIGVDGMAISVDACDRSMRQRAQECWMGMGGIAAVGAVRLAYEPTDAPATREKELVEEHLRRYGIIPSKNRA